MNEVAIPQSIDDDEPADREPVLDIRDLWVEYEGAAGAVAAVRGVSLAVAPGEVLGLAGESGSGKSSIAQAIVRILPPPAVVTGGQILIRGRDILDLDDAALRATRWRDVALVMQNASHALNPVITIGEQITDAIRAHEPVRRREARARAADLLDRVGVGAARLDGFPHQLSGGMRQRVAIAMALALAPPLLILDEPTTALDVVVQREILEELAELRHKLGFAVVFISHDLGLLFELADRVAVLYAGSIVEQGPAAALRQAPRHPYTQGLLASVPPLRGPRRTLTGVRGAPPDLRALPTGCPFHPRCDRAFAPCAGEAPPRRAASADHHHRCHLG